MHHNHNGSTYPYGKGVPKETLSRPKERVTVLYPGARCMGGRGGELPWAIYADVSEVGHGDAAQILGRGRTGASAWHAASKQIVAAHRKACAST